MTDDALSQIRPKLTTPLAIELADQYAAFVATRPLHGSQQVHQLAVVTRLQAWESADTALAAALFCAWTPGAGAVAGAEALQQAAAQAPPAAAEVIHHLLRMTAPLQPADGDREDRKLAGSLRERQLIRLAYLDLTTLLVIIADRGEWLVRAYGDEGREGGAVWQDTVDAFIPILEMLGLWSLRRQWLEMAVRRLHDTVYTSLRQRLKRQRTAIQRYVQYARSQLAVDAARLGLTLRVRDCSYQPGTLWYRHHRFNDEIDMLLARAIIGVEVDRSVDCYTALGLVHRLGEPLHQRFHDYMAQPRWNGYQELRTAVMMQSRTPRLNRRMLEFRIYSPAVLDISQRGVLAGTAVQAQVGDRPAGWWTQLERLQDELDWMRQRDIDQQSEPDDRLIYVFTPDGEVKLLSVGSSALDFAYRVHTQLGHQTRGVNINGLSQPLDRPLRNGDLVEITRDEYASGPDPAWLRMARNQRTRQRIRQGLAQINKAVHPGRSLLNRHLKSLETVDGFVIPKPQLERYLSQAAFEFHLGTVENLYEAILPSETPAKAGTMVAVERVVAYILENELNGAVIGNDGQPIVALAAKALPWSTDRLNFCPNCKPVPDAAIVLHRRTIRGQLRQTLHRASPVATHDEKRRSQKQLFGLPTGDRLICLENADAAELDHSVRWRTESRFRKQINLTLLGRDRPGLVGEVLTPIYADDRLNVSRIEAYADDHDGGANVVMTVDYDTDHQMQGLVTRLGHIPGVAQVLTSPLGDVVRSTKLARQPGDNPYSTGMPVRQRAMFFGREHEMEAILGYLLQGSEVITLHGQRRTGKTSLGRMLSLFVRGLPIRPIFIDLQVLSHAPTLAELYRMISRAVERAVPAGVARPNLADDADPHEQTQQLVDYLDQVQAAVRPQRILLILDEFNILVHAHPDDQSALFRQLRVLTRETGSGTTFMPITHTAHLIQDNPNPYLVQFYEQGPQVAVGPLTPDAARRLITDPVRTFLEYNDHVVTQIWRDCDCNPYLLNVVCYELVQRMRDDGRSYVRREDLQTTLQERILPYGNKHFDFITTNVARADRPWVEALARCQQEAEWVTRLEVDRLSGLDERVARDAVRRLQRFNIVEVKEAEGDHRASVRLRVAYFRDWVIRHWT